MTIKDDTKNSMILLEVSCWSVSLGQSTSLLLDPASQGELDLGVVHLCHEWAAALAGLNNLTPGKVNIKITLQVFKTQTDLMIWIA